MRNVLTLLAVAAMMAQPAQARQCLYEGDDPNAQRIFADVPSEHPWCAEIESLYRDGLTTGCGVDDEGKLLFCPDAPVTRAQAAAFAEHRDPFAQISREGRIRIGDHLRNAERVSEGRYKVIFTRDIQRCSIEAWPHSFTGPRVNVHAVPSWGEIDSLDVRTTVGEFLVDMDFSVRVHCE